jgi:hypothetical protein
MKRRVAIILMSIWGAVRCMCECTLQLADIITRKYYGNYDYDEIHT